MHLRLYQLRINEYLISQVNKKGGIQMRKMMLFVFGIFIFIINNSFVFGETIILKSGKTIEGKIIEKTGKYIKIDFYGVALTYYMDEVASIEGEKTPLPTDNVTSEAPLDIADLNKYMEQCFLNEKYEDAISGIKKMMQLKPNDPELYLALAIADYYTGHFEESVSAFQEASNLTPSDFPIHLYLGIVYDSMGDYEKARGELSTCIEQSRKKVELVTTFIAETLLKKIGNK